jgi:hypothetical protein
VNHCLRHFEEPVAAHCRECHHPFCGRCLVYSFGPKKPPYCLGCALYASGIRNGTRTLPPLTTSEPDAALDKRTQRAQRRADRDAEKAAAKLRKRAARAGATPPPPAAAPPEREAARTARVPAPSMLLARLHAQR